MQWEVENQYKLTRKLLKKYLSSFTQFLSNYLPQGSLQIKRITIQHELFQYKPECKSISANTHQFTFTGWKNSSTTFCALASSDDETPAVVNVAFEGPLVPELLDAGACLFGCLLRGAAGVLNSLHVKTIATAKPAIAPIERVFWYHSNQIQWDIQYIS